MQVTETIKYVGVNDHDIDLFEGQYDVRENGMAYNSYVVLGKKVAVADTVDARFVEEWLGNVETALSGRTPDYLVVHHMEPDHSAGIVAFMDRYPEAQVVASKMAFKMMNAYFGTDFADRQIVCKEGFELDLGARTLSFIGAANVHARGYVLVRFTRQSTVLCGCIRQIRRERYRRPRRLGLRGASLLFWNCGQVWQECSSGAEEGCLA